MARLEPTTIIAKSIFLIIIRVKANQRLFGKKMTGQQRYRKRIMTFFISLSLSRANEVLDKAITETKNFVV
ncbi:MAG: hypothetical protein RLP12_17680, partial [Ekhidna sp.]